MQNEQDLSPQSNSMPADPASSRPTVEPSFQRPVIQLPTRTPIRSFQPQPQDSSELLAPAESVQQAQPLTPQAQVPGGNFVASAAPQAEFQPPAVQDPPVQPVLTDDPQSMVGMSASQLGSNVPTKKKFPFKKVLIIGGIITSVLVVSLIALFVFGILSFGGLKPIEYVNKEGTRYNLEFYGSYTTTTLKSGNKQLVSKVSKNGKFPVTLSIAQGPADSYAKLNTCSTSNLEKVFEAQNPTLSQSVVVCSFPISNDTPTGVYVAGILHNDRTHIVTISQDISQTDLSSSSAAKQSLARFGLDPYHDDIKKIVTSIKIQ